MLTLFSTVRLITTASFQSIAVVQPDHSVDAGPLAPLVEPMIAVNPRDPSHIVVGAIVAPRTQDDRWSCGAFVSRNTGVTWMFHDLAIDRCIDPWVVFTDDGVLFTAIQIGRDIDGDERFHLVLHESEDGGGSWTTQPISIARRLDHVMSLPIAVTDARNRLILAGTGLRGSADAPWRDVALIEYKHADGVNLLADLRPSDLALHVTGFVQTNTGSFVASFVEYQRNVDGFRSEGFLPQARARVYLSRDLVTFSQPVTVDDNCASGVEGAFAGYPSLVVDTSTTAFSGRLYHACVRPGFDGIALTHSRDGGVTWSTQVRVDGSPLGAPGHARTPMLAVNAAGVVASTWYDRRNDPNGACQDLYGTVSPDGGETFLSPMRFSSVTSCPRVPGNGRAGLSWPMGGDYSSLTAASDGSFHIVWADSRSGAFRLRHAQFTASRNSR